ncbi:hypothetical protein F4805DRAFT_425164 [Annulohypoxylon moriforme]|nr:hypothetical protein F4805DRAFT_425164 [Annulohypoxylon moriforme]
MAILEEVPGIEVTVVVAGRDATEYDDPDASEQPNEAADCPTSTKYIECIDGANFSVKYHLTNDYDWSYQNHSLTFTLHADGTRLKGTVLKERDLRYGHKTTEIKEKEYFDAATQQWQGQKFKFSAVTTVDDVSKDRIKGDMAIAKNLGTIKVEIFRCQDLGACSTHNSRNAHKTSGYELSEKALKGKAISHGTSLSTPEYTRAPRFVDTRDLDKGPIAVFLFNYRSRDALKREMIIPRTPSPDPDAKPDIAHMSRAELERLAQERLEQLQGNGNVKQERKPIIKRELKRKADEVVDLSDDNPRSAHSPVFVDLTDD